MKNVISILNYWKVTLILGLFFGSFKYEVGELLESCIRFKVAIICSAESGKTSRF
jgi:hypothetical protein